MAHVSQFYHGNFNITFNDFVIENFFVFGEFEFHFWHTPLSIRMSKESAGPSIMQSVCVLNRLLNIHKSPT